MYIVHCIGKDKHKFKLSPTSNRKARQYAKRMFFHDTEGVDFISLCYSTVWYILQQSPKCNLR